MDTICIAELVESGDQMSDLRTTFFQKIVINLISELKPSYSYERLFNSAVSRSSCMFPMSGFWADALVIKQAEFRKKKRKKAHPLNDYEFPIPPTDYLVEKDVKDALEVITTASPELMNDFVIDSNVTLISDLLELNHIERLILQFSVYTGTGTGYPWDDFIYNISINSDFDDPVKLYAGIFDIAEEDVEKALAGFLFNSGLLVSQRRMKTFHCVAPEMAEIFTEKTLTAGHLSETLFPSCLETELTTDSYPHVSTEIQRAESIVQKSLANKSKGINLMFWGLAGTGKTELTLALAKKNGWDLKVIGDTSKMDMSEKSRAQRITSLKIAMKLYQNSENVVLLFDEMEDLFKFDSNATFSKAFINRIIETTPIPIIWTTNDLFSLGTAVLRRMTYNIGFEVPPRDARKKIWQGYVEKHDVALSSEIIDELATNYDIVPALIGNAVKIAKLADLGERDDVAEIVKSLDRLVNFGSKRSFKAVGLKDTPYDPRWVNSPTDLGELTGKLLTAKPRFSLCLYGASGTGKSEYGRYLAKKLDKRVLYKRASDLVSMWVGETEANIARAFEEAKREEMVFIIDEGDSFLRNREGAQRSWEVSQVNEMLAQMETHTQPFILTTNMMKDLDVAALRRFTFKMEFKYLRPDQSSEIFQAYFGSTPPAKLAKIDVLTPGDFAAVKDRADIIGETDPMKLYEMLIEECELKPDYTKTTIGF
jgi:SpoVK/Ycf46/Vps4 family AAA+-type ATPase